MAGDLPLDDLFSQTDTPAPVAEPAPPSPSDALAARVDGLTQMVNLLVQQTRDAQAYAQGQQQVRQQQSHQHTPQDQQPQGGWRPREYFTKADSLALLASQTPEETLNKVFNQVGQSVYEPIRQELAYAHQANQQLRQDMAAVYAREEQNRRAQDNQDRFYQAHEAIQPYAFLVPTEAQLLAQESQTNPAAFAGKSEADVHKLLAERVLARVKFIRGDTAAPDATTPAPSPGRGITQRTFMERGSGVRPGAPAAPKDANAAGLAAMAKYITGGR